MQTVSVSISSLSGYLHTSQTGFLWFLTIIQVLRHFSWMKATEPVHLQGLIRALVGVSPSRQMRQVVLGKQRLIACSLMAGS